jgi:hypothetical protein
MSIEKPSGVALGVCIACMAMPALAQSEAQQEDSAIISEVVVYATVGPPRTYGIRARYNFDKGE